jgi:hypothetical protein
MFFIHARLRRHATKPREKCGLKVWLGLSLNHLDQAVQLKWVVLHSAYVADGGIEIIPGQFSDEKHLQLIGRGEPVLIYGSSIVRRFL